MLQDLRVVFGVAALTAVATAGWMRQPRGLTPPQEALTMPVSSFEAPIAATPVSAAAVPVHSGIYRQTGPPVARSYPRVVQQSTRQRYSEPELRERSVERRRAETERDVEYRSEPVVKQRSTAKSVAIIGGSAAAGAAIGGLAGGGKGAAIGALGGGAAGLIYDRMTKNR